MSKIFPESIPSFLVHKVKTGRLLPPVNEECLIKAWKSLGKELLVFSKPDGDLPVVQFFDSPNLFASSVYTAFFKHFPLKINPSIVWLTIIQGFATYVDANAEALRSKFTSTIFGKKEIKILRPEFVRDQHRNKWEGVFPEISEKVTEFIGGPVAKLIENDFSNSTPTDKIATHIALMDVMKHYFGYAELCGCGIPYVELMGDVDDWQLIRCKAAQLLTYSVKSDPWLGKWLHELLLVLDQFVSAAEGKPDIAFWGSVCNEQGLSAAKGDPLTGWVQVFFPYLRTAAGPACVSSSQQPQPQQKPTPNEFMGAWRESYEDAKKRGVDAAIAESQKRGCAGSFIKGMPLDRVPSGLTRARVSVVWRDKQTPSEDHVYLYAGLTAIYQHRDGALEVRTGWGVVQAQAQEE